MSRNVRLACALLAALYFTGGASAHDGAHAAKSAAPTGPSSAFAFPLPEPGSYHLPPIRAAAGGHVLTEEGKSADLAELLNGRITVFSFIYTRCADICPIATMQLAELRELARRIPGVSERMQLASMSFDPDHDTAPVMAEYADNWRDAGEESPQWLFLTAPDQAALRPVLDAYGQAIAPDPEAAGRLNHILRVFLIDEAGVVRNIYSMDFLDPQLVLGDIRTLIGDRVRTD
jgi:protein SCO1/2